MPIKITINSREVKNPVARFLISLIGLVIFIVVVAFLFFLMLPLVWFGILFMMLLVTTLWLVLPKLIITYKSIHYDSEKLEKKQ
ncbi:MAG: hypothetical protein QNK24_04490 [Desulfuromusa sp.]|nr:hypothetical protein [Desulfuromusa sp.]